VTVGLGLEFALRPEVIVEAAVRQAGGAHELGDGHRLEPARAEKFLRRCDNVPPMLFGFFRADAHKALVQLDIYNYDHHH
jgi:hypothetical protein